MSYTASVMERRINVMYIQNSGNKRFILCTFSMLERDKTNVKYIQCAEIHIYISQ